MTFSWLNCAAVGWLVLLELQLANYKTVFFSQNYQPTYSILIWLLYRDEKKKKIKLAGVEKKGILCNHGQAGEINGYSVIFKEPEHTFTLCSSSK